MNLAVVRHQEVLDGALSQIDDGWEPQGPARLLQPDSSNFKKARANLPDGCVRPAESGSSQSFGKGRIGALDIQANEQQPPKPETGRNDFESRKAHGCILPRVAQSGKGEPGD